MPRPNIILIESDSMDGRAMGCMGSPAAHTPNMDRLAAGGALFRNAYSNFPLCCPSRASMWSGRYAHELAAWNNGLGLDEGAETFLTRLGRAGYRTEALGKTDYLSGHHSLHASVTSWLRGADIRLPQTQRPHAEVIGSDDPGRLADWGLIDHGVEWLERQAAQVDTPFVLYCGTGIPHPPFRASRKWLDLIDPAKVTLPPYEENLHPAAEYMCEVRGTLGPFSEQEMLAIRRTYLAMIAETDAMVGRLMQAVHDLGLADSTYFIYTSDHGEMNMEHRQWVKCSLYEAAVRVPLLVAGPGIEPGTVVDDLVSLIDLYPTLMDMAGVDPPVGPRGHSLAPLLAGDRDHRPEWVFSEYHGQMANTGMFMLRRGDLKYMVCAGYAPQLFDLGQDPDEIHNLAEARPEDAAAMDAKLREVVDYERVDRQAKDCDRESFRKWREGLGRDAYLRAMDEQIYRGQWTPDQERRVARWLGE